jgi:hypothetical protein
MLTGLITVASLPFLHFFTTTIVQSYICQAPTNISIVSPADNTTLTADTNIVVSGTATASSTVTLSTDGTPFANLTADQNNTFAAQTQFAAGSHVLSVSASSVCGNASGQDVSITATPAAVTLTPAPVVDSTPSVQLSTTTSVATSSPVVPNVTNPVGGYDTIRGGSSGLALSVQSPTDSSSTTAPSIFVSGTTSQASTIEIDVNGKAVANTAVSERSYGLMVPLTLGQNSIMIQATDGSNRAGMTLTVTRTPIVSQTPWYKTTVAKVAIVGGSSAIVVAGVVILIILL